MEQERKLLNNRIFLAACLPLALAACGGGSIGLDESSTAVTVTDDLPAPDVTRPSVDFTDYRIGPNDKIAVSVFEAEELNREGSVDAAGNFSMPLIGTVKAGGRTPQELSDAISDELRGDYIREPQVAVNILEARANTVTIDGSVRRPGVYPVIGTLTLQQAIATAAGADEYADLNSVVVFRTSGGQQLAALFDLQDIRSGRVTDPRIFANDIVIVGEDATRRLLRDFQFALPLARFVPIP